MSKMKRSLWYMLVLIGSLFLTGVSAQAASAEKQLQKGIEAYQKNDNNKAMDYFIDVLMSGDSEQVIQANKYIDAIHNQVGGIRTPVEVNVNFPEQPTQTIVNRAENLANYGTETLETLATDSEELVKQKEMLTPQTLTQQIEQRQLSEYLQNGQSPVVQEKPMSQDAIKVLGSPVGTEEAAPQAAGAGTVSQLKTVESKAASPVQEPQAVPQAAGAETVSQLKTVESKAASPVQEPQAVPQAAGAETVSQLKTVESKAASQVQEPQAVPRLRAFEPKEVPQVQEPQAAASQQVMSAVYQAEQPGSPSTSSVFADLTSSEAVEARNLYTAQKLQSMTNGAIAKLSANKGMHLYFRSDGRPDALDIDEGVLFYKNSFRSDALQDLNSIYELLALTQGARYVILPAGSYTDDVTLGGIRQAMALKSYLVKRGISQGKLYYNMGLVAEEVPAQFSNLKGLSIVFDYEASLPVRVLENEEKETAPLLSMALVPACHAIDRSLGEAYAIDFSVLETVDTLDNWTLQVIQHGRDGNYYIVRQLEGFSPVYHQILWNGRKGIIGPELPCGKYTAVLSAVDVKGQTQTLRRRLVVRCAPDPVASCQMGSCPAKKGGTSKATAAFSYKSARLWTKPVRVMPCSHCADEQAETARTQAVADTTARQTEQAASTATDSNSYTVTKTVRNVVTDDNSLSSGEVSSQEEIALPPVVDAGGYSVVPDVSAVDNPYAMPYEEEYAEISY